MSDSEKRCLMTPVFAVGHQVSHTYHLRGDRGKEIDARKNVGVTGGALRTSKYASDVHNE